MIPGLICVVAAVFDYRTDPRVVTSDSTGSLTVLSLAEENLSAVSQWKAHDFEAWISAFSYWDTQLIYSG